MDVEYDSELEDIPEIDLSVQVQPYMYEPPARSIADHQISSESSENSRDSDENGQIEIPEPGEWCSCNHCGPMPTIQESKCCNDTNIVDGKVEDGGLQCITDHEGFLGNCLNEHVIEASYYEFIQNEGLQEETLHETCRYIAYRRFARWIYHVLPKKDRRILPACVVTAIRKRFPSDQYIGFKHAD